MDVNTLTVQVISASGVVVAAFISAYSARQTLRMLRTMQAANESNSRPVISISLEDRPESVSFVDLALTNAGNGLARDIQFELLGEDPNLIDDDDSPRRLSDMRLVQRGAKTLAPHEVRRFWLASIMSSSQRLAEADIRLRVTYFNSDKSKKYSDVFELDFSSLPESRVSEDPLYRLAEEAEEISRQLSRLNSKQGKTSGKRR